MILVKCGKCKRVSVEISKEKAIEDKCLEAVKECMCGNSYENFLDFKGKDLPLGITLETILRRTHG